MADGVESWLEILECIQKSKMADINSISGSILITSEFKWKIPNFLQKLETSTKERVSSPIFPICDSNNISGEFQLDVFPQGVKGREDDAGYIALYLYRKGDNKLNLTLVVSIQDGNNIKRRERTCMFEMQDATGVGFDRFIKIDDLMKNAKDLLPSDSLTIAIDIKRPESKSSATKVVENLQQSYLKMEYTDMKILCNGQTFPCHRFMLSAMSPYFAAVVGKGFKEGLSKEINLDAMKPEILKEMLFFMYTGKLENLDANAIDLFKAGDQYQLDHLKEICGLHLSSKLNLENVLDILTLADRYNDNKLKESTLDFVVKNITSLMDTPTWKEIGKEFPDLVVEILQTVVKKRVV